MRLLDRPISLIRKTILYLLRKITRNINNISCGKMDSFLMLQGARGGTVG
jgi:hypothetical protein